MEYALALIIGVICSILIGVICGGLIVWILSRRKIIPLEKQVKIESEGRVVAETKLESQQKAAEEKLALWEDAEQKLSNAFKALSAEALKSSSTQFLELATTHLKTFQEEARGDLENRQQAIDNLVNPLKDSLKNIDDELGKIENKRTEDFGTLAERLSSLATSTTDLKKETANLVTALRRPAGRAKWGEMQLRNVVELAGMTRNCDFIEKKTVTTEDSWRQPDMVIRLPRSRNIVVDSKVPLEAYLDAIQTEDDGVRQNKLKEHAKHVRTHISNLGSKGYQEQFQPGPECVVLFLPGDPFFIVALQEDPTLIEFGMEKHVWLACPTTLIALLKGVAYDWRQQQIAENAQVISKLGKELYDRAYTLYGHFDDLRKGLTGAVDAYNKAAASFESRILVTARRLRELGAATGDEIETLPTIDTTPRMIETPNLKINEIEKDNKKPKQNSQNPT